MNGPKDDKKNIKLKVDFLLDERKFSSHETIDGSDALRSKLSKGDAVDSNNESVISELLALRKKYDAVVEYTVHLTAERDTVVSQLDECQKELNREKQKKKNEKGSSSYPRAEKVTDGNNFQQVIYSITLPLNKYFLILIINMNSMFQGNCSFYLYTSCGDTVICNREIPACLKLYALKGTIEYLQFFK